MNQTDWNSPQRADPEGMAAADYLLVKEDGPSSKQRVSVRRGLFDSIDYQASSRSLRPKSKSSLGPQGRMSDEMSAELFEQIAIERSEVAFKEFYDLVSRKVYLVIFRILRSEDDARDLLQEVFTMFWTSAPDLYKFHSNITAWILLLARNRAIDETRSKRFRGQRATESYDDILHGYLVEESHSPDERLTTESTHVEIQRAFEVLNPQHREIMELIFFGGMSMKSVAETLQIPAGTVRKTVFSSIRKLRRVLQPDEAGPKPLKKKSKGTKKNITGQKIAVEKKEKKVKAMALPTAEKPKRAEGKSRRASKLHTILDDLIMNRDGT